MELVEKAIRAKVFTSQPGTFVEATLVVRQLESACKACRAVPSIEMKKAANVVSASADGEKISSEIRELKEFNLGMNEKTRELAKKAETTATASAKVMWFVMLAADTAILRGIIHTEKRQTERGVCHRPDSSPKTCICGPSGNDRQ